MCDRAGIILVRVSDRATIYRYICIGLLSCVAISGLKAAAAFVRDSRSVCYCVAFGACCTFSFLSVFAVLLLLLLLSRASTARYSTGADSADRHACAAVPRERSKVAGGLFFLMSRILNKQRNGTGI